MLNLYRLFFVIGISTLLSGCVVSSGGKTTIAVVACAIAVVGAAVGQFHCGREDRIARKAELLDRSLREHVSKYHGKETNKKVTGLRTAKNDGKSIIRTTKNK